MPDNEGRIRAQQQYPPRSYPRDVTRDSLAPWGLTVAQSRAGFRFGLDAVMLASTVTLAPGEVAVELGAGVGIVSLILAKRFPGTATIVAVELEEEAAGLARANVRDNEAGAVHVVRADYTRFALATPAAVVFGNPPYRTLGRGNVPADPRRRLARFEVRATLRSTVAAAACLLAPGGRLHLIYASGRAAELDRALVEHGFGLAARVEVSGVEGAAPGHVLIEAHAGGVAFATRHERIAILRRDGGYTPRAAEIYGCASANGLPRGGWGARAAAAGERSC